MLLILGALKQRGAAGSSARIEFFRILLILTVAGAGVKFFELNKEQES